MLVMDIKNCIECGKPIPKIRLKALPNTLTCVKCSQVKPVVGITIWNKTSSELITVDESEARRLREMEKLDGRLNRLK